MGFCVCICAIDNNYSKDPMIKTTKDLKSLFYFEAFLAALLSWPYWALKMCPSTAQLTLHLPKKKQLKENYNLHAIHCMVICTHIFVSIINTKDMFYVILYHFKHALICIFFGKGASGSECEGKTVFEIGRSALKFEYLILGPNWDPRTETWPGRTPEGRKGGPFLPETWPGQTPRAGPPFLPSGSDRAKFRCGGPC